MTSSTKKFATCAMSCGRLRPSASTALSMREPQFRLLPRLDDEVDDEGGKERVDADGFGERDAQDHVGLDGGAGLGIAAEGFHRLTHQVTDGERRAQTTNSHRDGGAECLGGVCLQGDQERQSTQKV